MKKYICFAAVFLLTLYHCYGQSHENAAGMEGIYLPDKNDERHCRLQISLTKKGNGYVYQVVTDKRNRKGKVILTKDGSDTYIRFAGLKADENNGDLEGLLSGDAITIQNTGNEMNYYVRLSECDEKYITLTKQPLPGKHDK